MADPMVSLKRLSDAVTRVFDSSDMGAATEVGRALAGAHCVLGGAEPGKAPVSTKSPTKAPAPRNALVKGRSPRKAPPTPPRPPVARKVRHWGDKFNLCTDACPKDCDGGPRR